MRKCLVETLDVKVLFDKLAKAELEDASEYYEFEVPGFGSQFREEGKNLP